MPGSMEGRMIDCSTEWGFKSLTSERDGKLSVEIKAAWDGLIRSHVKNSCRPSEMRQLRTRRENRYSGLGSNPPVRKSGFSFLCI